MPDPTGRETTCDHCCKPVSEEDAVRPGLGVGHGMTLHEPCLLDMIDAVTPPARETT